MTTTALALFSGGLDSILACRVVAAQGIKVKAVKFVTPFFDYNLLAREDEYRKDIKNGFDIDVRIIDLSKRYLELLRAPAHGFGKNFNPCLDCKILMISETKKMLDDCGASFIITGEVLGQRPMSQRMDTLRIIERDSGCEGLLLRPLSAKLLNPTRPEAAGLIDRERLLDFSGRGRKRQMELAGRLGIVDYPTPAGGCILTDPVLGARIKRLYRESEKIEVRDILCLLTGRQFHLPGGGRFSLGRNQRENERIAALARPGDIILEPLDLPGPTGLLRGSGKGEEIEAAAGLLAGHTKKAGEGGKVRIVARSPRQGINLTLVVLPLPDETTKNWRR